jgi:signal transduction histidine kinase
LLNYIAEVIPADYALVGLFPGPVRIDFTNGHPPGQEWPVRGDPSKVHALFRCLLRQVVDTAQTQRLSMSVIPPQATPGPLQVQWTFPAAPGFTLPALAQARTPAADPDTLLIRHIQAEYALPVVQNAGHEGLVTVGVTLETRRTHYAALTQSLVGWWARGEKRRPDKERQARQALAEALLGADKSEAHWLQLLKELYDTTGRAVILELRRVADYIHDVKAFLLSDVDWLAAAAESGDLTLLAQRQAEFLARCDSLIETCQRAIAGGLELGDPDIERQPFDLAQDLIQPLYETWRARLAGQGIELAPPEINMPYPLEGDAGALRQALDHLFWNSLEAWKVLPKERWQGATVTLQAAYDAQRQQVEILYIDQAGGLDRSIQERLFSGRRIFSHKPGGTGYGLVYVLNVVRNHGGSLEIVANKRQGKSTFRLWLPAPRPPAAGDRGRVGPPGAEEKAGLAEAMLPIETLHAGFLMSPAEARTTQGEERRRLRPQRPGQQSTGQPKDEP